MRSNGNSNRGDDQCVPASYRSSVRFTLSDEATKTPRDTSQEIRIINNLLNSKSANQTELSPLSATIRVRSGRSISKYQITN